MAAKGFFNFLGTGRDTGVHELFNGAIRSSSAGFSGPLDAGLDTWAGDETGCGGGGGGAAAAAEKAGEGDGLVGYTRSANIFILKNKQIYRCTESTKSRSTSSSRSSDR